jgi:signal transduction histidine kinase
VNYRQLQHLAAAMAHEVRNPLNSMAIHIELLEGRLKKEAAQNTPERAQILKSVATLQGEIDRIDKILDEYLTYAGPDESPRRAVEPAALVGDAIDRARALADQRRVRVEVKTPKELDRWSIDADGVGEALDALLVNAIEASREDSTVTITVQADEDQGEVIVADQGIGIPPEDLPRIFHLGFTRRDRRGIGLTVAKQIVKGHGGSITAESKGANLGATFRLRLPIEAES